MTALLLQLKSLAPEGAWGGGGSGRGAQVTALLLQLKSLAPEVAEERNFFKKDPM